MDIFLCADSLATRLWEPMFILFTINPVSLATRLWEPMFILFTINPVFSWIYSQYGTEIILKNEKGLIVVVRICNRNRFHKQEQNTGTVYVKEQWEQSSLDDVDTHWTSKEWEESGTFRVQRAYLAREWDSHLSRRSPCDCFCPLADYLSKVWKL